MRTTPLKLVVFPSLVLSFHKGGLPAVSVVRRQLDKLYRNRVLNTAWLIHGLLDVVSDSLMPVVDAACKTADDMEDLIYVINPGRESHKDVLRRMGAITRRLTFLRQRLWSKRDILTSLIEKVSASSSRRPKQIALALIAGRCAEHTFCPSVAGTNNATSQLLSCSACSFSLPCWFSCCIVLFFEGLGEFFGRRSRSLPARHLRSSRDYASQTGCRD
jgi:hypothetical protein